MTLNINRYLIALALTFSVFTEAKAQMTICNDSDKDYVLAYAMQSGLQVFSKRWDVQGWYKLGPGCSSIRKSQILARAFVLLAEQGKSGLKYIGENDVNIIEAGRNASLFNKPDVQLEKAERAICIKNTAFEIDNSTWDKITNCSTGWIRQPFTFWFANAEKYWKANVIISNRAIRVTR